MLLVPIYLYIFIIILFENTAWWILEETFDGICKFLQKEFGSYVVRERQLWKMRIEVSAYDTNKVNNENIRRKRGNMFGAIETNKKILRLQDYSISQTSLEQIFNQFAAQQEEETGHAAGIV